MYTYKAIRKDRKPKCDWKSGLVLWLTCVLTLRVKGDNRDGNVPILFVANMGFVVCKFVPKCIYKSLGTFI